MGIVRAPQGVKLFASVIYRGEAARDNALSSLERAVGPIEEHSETIPFTWTQYYEKEMGTDLMRLFVLFAPLVGREELPGVKKATNSIEKDLAVGGRRTANIDPGYIALEHVILATTKGYAHRIYLGEGIHADLTLMFHQGSYHPLQWTYPDYAMEQAIFLFNRWREIYKQSLKMQTRE